MVQYLFLQKRDPISLGRFVRGFGAQAVAVKAPDRLLVLKRVGRHTIKRFHGLGLGLGLAKRDDDASGPYHAVLDRVLDELEDDRVNRW